MQSAVRFLLVKPGADPNREVNAFLQKIVGCELLSVSHQYMPNGLVVALAFRNVGDVAKPAPLKMTSVTVPK